MTLIVLIAKIISSYKGYIRKRRKEDDLAIRTKILECIEGTKHRLEYILQFLSDDIKCELKNLIDSLDILTNTIEYSFSGHQYPFFSPQTSVSERTLKKIMRHDLSILKGLSRIRELCSELEIAAVENRHKEFVGYLSELQNQLLDFKEEYTDREDTIRGIH